MTSGPASPVVLKICVTKEPWGVYGRGFRDVSSGTCFLEALWEEGPCRFQDVGPS